MKDNNIPHFYILSKVQREIKRQQGFESRLAHAPLLGCCRPVALSESWRLRPWH